MNTRTRTVSVHSQALNRQANNLDIDQLANAVKPWFDEMIDEYCSRNFRSFQPAFTWTRS